jgi:hypothetical protein
MKAVASDASQPTSFLKPLWSVDLTISAKILSKSGLMMRGTPISGIAGEGKKRVGLREEAKDSQALSTGGLKATGGS